MGLDAVEIVLEIEDAFDIKIPDEHAEAIRTVGELHDYIVAIKGDTPSPPGVCLSAATFYMIRRAVCEKLRLDQRALRPKITLESTLPRRGRRHFWTSLQTRLGLQLPRLARPKWVVLAAIAMCVVASTWASLLALQQWGTNGATAAFIATLLVSAVFTGILTTPLQTEFRPAFATYRGLSNAVLAHNYPAIARHFNAGNSMDVWNTIKVIIVEQLHVNPDVVTRDASFVNDLGMD